MKGIRSLAGRLGRWLLQVTGEAPTKPRLIQMEDHPLTTQVRLQLDRERTLRFTGREAVAFLRKTGISIWTGAGTPNGEGLDIGRLELDQLLELLAIACSAEDPAVTAEALAPHVGGERLFDVVAALMVLVGDFLPEPSEEAAENPLVASALLRWMNGSTGLSPLKRSGSRSKSTGASLPD
jgi:hypothetical protein